MHLSGCVPEALDVVLHSVVAQDHFTSIPYAMLRNSACNIAIRYTNVSPFVLCLEKNWNLAFDNKG